MAAALAKISCQFEVVGTTVPPSSGNPVVIDDVSGTVISANFFNGGAINSPYFDGLESVSVCVSQPDSKGERTAHINTNVGLDNDFIIKGYPQFVVGTKFGNLFETSHRFYNNTGLPEEDRWPVVATGLDPQGFPFEFANLEYISDKRDVGLPAFTDNLPNITISLDVDETNVVGAERDVMLESWFFDTSRNANLIGNNIVTNGPIANTLNNIVGVGHEHYPQLDNTLLEMMVHIGPLSPHDISGSKNNPGQNQLTEIHSGLDFDQDGIDDHFDVDSHAYLESTNPLDPKPGIYSSGIDQNEDGIDDADLLPVVIDDFAYSIWYGETFLTPVVIFSRETNTSLTNDFDPSTADINLTEEGEISLRWNEFLNYTLFEVESKLQNLNVAWASGGDNPFPAMRAAGGAIGGVEFGVEPQTNNQADEPYRLNINRYVVEIDGKPNGLIDIKKENPISDIISPTAETTSPIAGSSISPAITNITGTSANSESEVKRVGVIIRRVDLTPSQHWDGNAWVSQSTTLNANLHSNGDWDITDVDLTTDGRYRIFVNARDNSGNVATFSDNPTTNFDVQTIDTNKPTVQIESPANDSTLNPAITNISGTSTDSESEIDRVGVIIRRVDVTPSQHWDCNAWVSQSTTLIANLHSNSDWDITDVDLTTAGRYRIFVNARDNSGNVATFSDNPTINFDVQTIDTNKPTIQVESPANDSTLTPAITNISGTSTDLESGVDRVGVIVRRVDVTPSQHWDGNAWVTQSTTLIANLHSNGDGDVSGIDLTTAGRYRIFANARDNSSNVATFSDNLITKLTIEP